RGAAPDLGSSAQARSEGGASTPRSGQGAAAAGVGLGAEAGEGGGGCEGGCCNGRCDGGHGRHQWIFQIARQWAQENDADTQTSPMVSGLVDDGAICVGKTTTDEMSYRTWMWHRHLERNPTEQAFPIAQSCPIHQRINYSRNIPLCFMMRIQPYSAVSVEFTFTNRYDRPWIFLLHIVRMESRCYCWGHSLE
ncbi:unnamed protein product, partial [Urochloa humidicola]